MYYIVVVTHYTVVATHHTVVVTHHTNTHKYLLNRLHVEFGQLEFDQ